MTEPRPIDASLRAIAAEHSQDFLNWFIGPGARVEQVLDTVMVTLERRSDFLVSFEDIQGQLRLCHAEFQGQIKSDPALHPPFRMFEYAAFVRRRYGQIPVQTLVLLQDSAAARRIPDHFAEGSVRVEYRLIRLWEQDPRLILDGGPPGLLPLVPLMAGPVAELIEESFDALEERIESGQQRNDLLKVAALLASLRARPEVILSFLRNRSMLNLLEDTPLGQQLLAEREARGRKEGRQEGERRILVRVLTSRFGQLPEEVLARLEGITDTARLEQLADAVSTVPDLESFHRWL